MATSITSATATPTPTPTPTSASVVSSAAQSLLTSLNSGSGVDTTSLVASLVQAQYATKTAALATQATTLTTQISGVSALKSAITGFASALESLVKGGTLTTQPTVSNSTVLSATALSGAKLAGLSSSVTVSQLASAQTVRTKDAVDRTAVVGGGTLTLQFGTATYGPVDDPTTTDVDESAGAGTPAVMTGFTASGAAIPITIPAGSDLDGVVKAINTANQGVTASIVTNADGSAYVSLKSATGAAKAFTLTASSDSDAGLSALNVGVDKQGANQTTITGVAQNAKLTVDGIAVERSANTVDDLITGVKLTLNATSTVPVTLGSSTPTTALSQAVSDFVDTYNQVYTIITAQTDPITGSLRSDPAAASLLRSLKSLTNSVLLPNAASGTPTTLGAIGVATNRDGTLQVNSATLIKTLASNQDSVEAMFAFSSDATSGISSLLNTISTASIDTTFGLGASATKYTAAQAEVASEQTDLTDQSTTTTDRLTKQFAAMNTRVTAYKSIQSFLTGQIAAWNKTDS